MKKLTVALSLAAAVLLAACGGGDDEPAATSEVPSSASESIGGFVTYLKRLVVSSDDTLEPVDTMSVVGPTDETSEPVAVD